MFSHEFIFYISMDNLYETIMLSPILLIEEMNVSVIKTALIYKQWDISITDSPVLA